VDGEPAAAAGDGGEVSEGVLWVCATEEAIGCMM